MFACMNESESEEVIKYLSNTCAGAGAVDRSQVQSLGKAFSSALESAFLPNVVFAAFCGELMRWRPTEQIQSDDMLRRMLGLAGRWATSVGTGANNP